MIDVRDRIKKYCTREYISQRTFEEMAAQAEKALEHAYAYEFANNYKEAVRYYETAQAWLIEMQAQLDEDYKSIVEEALAQT